MKEILITNCEKKFVQKCLDDDRRVDGRAFDEFRPIIIDFGNDWGCCQVSMGETRILAQVSCEIQQPKATRPNEGILNLNVDLSPMGAPNFEPGRQSEMWVHLNRMLEKCIKDSRAVDLESLCIKLNEKVWTLRVDLNVLNHEGNLVDCASIAALTALAHFKRPDVTSDGEKIIVHSYEQRDPIPTTIHHYPVCISYGIFNEGELLIADPTLLEEGVSDAQLTFAVNAFKEICSLHLGGSALANTYLLMTGAKKAATRAFNVVQLIRDALDKDTEARKHNQIPVFDHFIGSRNNRDLSQDKLKQCLHKWTVKEKSKKKKKSNKSTKQQDSTGIDEEPVRQDVDLNELTDMDAGHNAEPSESTEIKVELLETSDDEPDVQIVDLPPVKIEKIDIIDSAGSEEEAVVILNPEVKSKKNKNKKQHNKK